MIFLKKVWKSKEEQIWIQLTLTHRDKLIAAAKIEIAAKKKS
jgi:hypothetical protein